MDDALEQPDAQLPTTAREGIPQEDGNQGSDDEGDVVLDWTKLLPSSARPVIPRRGEKEFEPQPGGGSGLQVHVLDRARNAMFEALRATRTISSKSISYAIWYPELSRAHVTVPRGTLFTSIGHSAPRPVDTEDGSKKLEKRMEILPEEALYLIERGSLFCWKATDLDLSEAQGLEEVHGSPMSVQQAFSEMIGTEGLTLERYQVYAYLKRLGYVVTRTTPPETHYPVPPPFDLSPLNRKTSSVLSRIISIFRYPFWQFFAGRFDWWKPFRMSRWLLKDKNYGTIFRSLRFIPSGHGVPLLPIKSEPAANPSPYHLFFNVHKPGSSYRKTSPALPDYQIVVINARTTPMPTLRELTDLFDISPELPPPLPRQRRPLKAGDSSKPAPSKPATPLSLSHRVLHLFRPPPPENTPPPRRPHPFMAIKAGKKSVVVAAVDAGNTSFFRFGQGAFSEWALF